MLTTIWFKYLHTYLIKKNRDIEDLKFTTFDWFNDLLIFELIFIKKLKLIYEKKLIP